MIIRTMLAVVLLTAGTAEAKLKSAVDSNVIGEWGVNGQLFAVFKADGTGAGGDGPFRWSADGHTLAITDGEGTERIPYEMKDGRLLVTIEGNRMVLERMKTGGARAEGRAGGGTKAAPDQTPGPDQLSQLLLSSAWCSFSYNKVSGASHSSRAQFFPDGTWSAGSRGETYSSGSGGSVAGQHDSDSRGQWKVQNGQLFMSNPPESPALAPVGITVTRNSNGYPIITADGTEYSQCR
jgi:hypothetical protein